MRTRTRTYGGGEMKKVGSKPVTSKSSVAKLQNKFKSKDGRVKKELKSDKMKVNIKKATKVMKSSVDDQKWLDDGKVFTQSFVQITPINSRRLSLTTSSKKAGKYESSSKKQHTLPEKSTSAAGRRSRSSPRSSEKNHPSSSKIRESRTTIATKRSANVSLGASGKKSKDSPTKPSSRFVIKDVTASSKKTTGSTKPKKDTSPKTFKSPRGSTSQAKFVIRYDLSERKMSDKKAVGSSIKPGVESLDELSFLARPSLLSKSSLYQAGQKRKRSAANTYDQREPTLKRSSMSRMITSPATYTTIKDNNKESAGTARKSLLETPLNAQVHYNPVEGNYETSSSSSYALKAPAAAMTSSHRGINSAVGASELLSPGKRGVWEIEGRRSTLLDKLWSWSPTSMFSKSKNKTVVDDDGREIESGFSYREHHYDTDVNTSSLQFVQELDTKPSIRLRSAAALDKKTQMEEAATKLLTSSEVKNKQLNDRTMLKSVEIKSKHSMITGRCVACTVASVVACAVCGTLAFMSLGYLYT